MLTLNSGMLAAFILGHFCTYNMAAIIQLIIPFIFLITFPFFPETPQYFLDKGQKEVIVFNLE